MSPCRIALANLPFPTTPEESVAQAEQAIAQASLEGAQLICFPECFIPGYRGMGKSPQPPDAQFLERAWSAVAAAAAKTSVTVVLGTERIVNGRLLITALVINRDGGIDGFQDTDFQDKVQLDPSEEATYTAGSERRIFQAGPLTFGIAICHEGWRYPETVRWAARQGAHIVFHPHFHQAEPGSYRPSTFADPANSFHQGYKNNKEIATQLGTTEQIIKNYLRNVYDKIGVSDRLELELFTIHHRILAEAAAATTGTSAPAPQNMGAQFGFVSGRRGL